MGRAPCCDKASVKKGPWAPEEDATLKDYIEKHGTGGNWIALPQKAGLKRCGKSCRLRWLNYLRPNIKHGDFTEFEDRIICTLYASIGSRWSVIAAQLPGRTDNDIKNYWNTKLKKKLMQAVLPPLRLSQAHSHRTNFVSPHQASSFLFSQVPHLMNSHTHHIPLLTPLPPLLSPSYSLPPSLESPLSHEINFENPMLHYQVKKHGNSITYGGSGVEATCSSSEANYNFSSASSTANGTNSDQSASYDYYPYQDVEEKENLVRASSEGGGGWTQEAAAGKTWGEHAVVADYGFEEIKQLISINNSTCSLLFDENKVGESVYY